MQLKIIEIPTLGWLKLKRFQPSFIAGDYEKTDAGRDWGQEEKGMTEDEMAGWHHWLDGCVFEWTLGDGDGQGDQVCCNSWGRTESDTTERLNWCKMILNILGIRASLVAQLVKNLPVMQETWVQSLGWEDPLEKGTATHSSILAWRIPWTCIVHGVAKSRTRLSDFHFTWWFLIKLSIYLP